ncbi:PREDICTED: vitamin K-dependent gamma-carboxylase [Acromyrmex echinatior]|uniref:Vitamin K-dependent gamma-carboxylase n=1 Tax=Acromyrmex echinatior TaxID=103372 RepID=F4WV65_ACREC|nr:PREDICTED: vitamin K-dependent gamma-carboxylase [Acromyrmex echinatior]EGI61953.1 Vitamin K-dependent gamma-carboxylase [Acromyrmex echinatior]
MWKKKDGPEKNASTSPNDGSYIKNYVTFVSERWSLLKSWFNNNFERLFSFKISDVSSFEKFVQLLYRPTDPASLGVARALFGVCMVIDVIEERGFSDIDIKWGDPWDCHFPLIHGMMPPSLSWMIMIYTVMWMGAFGIALGLRFRIACACFVLPYWYIFLLEKTYWNNHTYLYGVVATLFWGTEANKYFALDASNAKRDGKSVPYWNYFILKFQFFALYFLAGLKKFSREWLEGYAMINLSKHWVFYPFKIFLSTEQIDFLIVHWFGFIFDLSVGFWMLFEKTRIPSMVFCTTFHLMNSRLFNIGMFPYVCLATMPLFCRADWPRKLELYFGLKQKILPINANSIDVKSVKETDSQVKESVKPNYLKLSSNEIVSNETMHKEKVMNKEKDKKCFIKSKSEKKTDEKDNDTQSLKNSIKVNEKGATNVCKKNWIAQQSPKTTRKQKFVASLLLCHILLQFFLPYSHFISKGYNNWVPGLYGYSWDMMVHSWDTIHVVIKVHDNANDEVRYLDPVAWVQNDRWMKHGDMAIQYSQCLKNNLMRRKEELRTKHYSEDMEKWMELSTNFSVYIDVWCSLNGRFQQRIFNPNIDMLTVDWHPFKPVSFLMPLLTQYSSYRHKMDEIQQHVYTWSNYTDVLFVADFPGMYLENYISTDFMNVSLTVLEGEVTYGEEESMDVITVSKKKSISVGTGKFHRIKTTSSYPACYMYTYTNQTKQLNSEKKPPPVIENMPQLLKEINYKIIAWIRTFVHITNAFLNLMYDVPMVRRVRVSK